MKKFILPALIICAFCLSIMATHNGAFAAEKSRAALQTDLANHKYMNFEPEVMYSDMINQTDSDFNKTTDTLDDIPDGSTNSLIPAADATKLGDITASAVEINLAADISANSEIVTGANVLEVAECGKTVGLSTTGHAETLPTPTLGCKFDFVVLTAGQLFTIITTGAETIKGLAFEAETDTGDDGPTTAGADTISFVSGTAAVGDRGSLWSDGTNWNAIMFSSNDGAITFTSAI